MTDYQLKAIFAIFNEMLSKCKTFEDYEETKRQVEVLAGNLGIKTASKSKSKSTKTKEDKE